MNRKKSIRFITLIVIFLDLTIVITSIILSLLPMNDPNWSFSVSDFIQLLVVEVALLGPILFENWKKQRSRASISFVGINTQEDVDNKDSNPYNKIYRIEIINNSDVLLRNCKVLLAEIKVADKNQTEKTNKFVSKNIYRYLNWHSLEDLTINLNPNEPATFVLGQLIGQWLFASEDFSIDKQFFQIPYFSENINVEDSTEQIQRTSLLYIKIFSENADILNLDLQLIWPENVLSEKELADKLIIKSVQ